MGAYRMMRVWPAGKPVGQDGAAPTDEPALARRARKGDPAAFGALVELHQDAIYRLALRMVGPDEAEDIAQQAFVKAWRALGRFDERAAFGTWLYRIAVNQCLDHLRRARRFRPLPLDDVDRMPSGEADIAESLADAEIDRARRAALDWALERIPSEDRLLLHLRVGEELSYDEIAARLGLNPRTVGTRLYRARMRLHRLAVERLEEGRQ